MPALRPLKLFFRKKSHPVSLEVKAQKLFVFLGSSFAAVTWRFLWFNYFLDWVDKSHDM